MGANSIRVNIRKEDIISEIRLTLGADIKKERIILLLEGVDDIKVMAKLVTEKVDVIESFSGKEGVKEIIENHFTSNSRLIGIVDKDYEIKPISHKLFFYDYCCLEMMIISYIDLFQSIYYEYYDSRKLDVNELKEILLKNTRHMSIMRKYNYENSLELKFKGLSINNVLEDNKLNCIKLLEEMKKRKTKDVDFDKIEDMLNKEICREWKMDELLEITQGHDFIGIFHCYCKKDSGKEPSKDDIASSLRCSFNNYYFKKTNLHKKLVEYQINNNLKIV